MSHSVAAWLAGSAICFSAAALAVVPARAAATAQEVLLAQPADALAFCQSGMQPTNSIAYIAGPHKTAQFGPGYGCVQKVVTKSVSNGVKNALQVVNGVVSQCNLASKTKAVLLCQNNGMGTYDIAYFKGVPGETVNGPGYGCTTNFSTSGIGNAICAFK